MQATVQKANDTLSADYKAALMREVTDMRGVMKV